MISIEDAYSYFYNERLFSDDWLMADNQKQEQSLSDCGIPAGMYNNTGIFSGDSCYLVMRIASFNSVFYLL